MVAEKIRLNADLLALKSPALFAPGFLFYNPTKNPILRLPKKNTMWGANQWTDSMFKKYWWVAALLTVAFFVVRTAL